MLLDEHCAEHAYVTTTTFQQSENAIWNEILNASCNFLQQRINDDESSIVFAI